MGKEGTVMASERLTRVLIYGLVCLTLVLSNCGGGGGGGGGSGAGITISGWVINYAGYDVPGATVTLKKASDNSSITSTVTASNGTFSVNYGPVAGQEVYLNASAPTYVSSNSEIGIPTSSLSSIEITVVDAADAVSLANLITGHTGTTWTSDTFYTGKSWVVLDVYNPTWYFISGVTFTTNPAATLLKYNDGSDIFSSTIGPTVGDPSGLNMYAPSAAGYYSAGNSFTVSAAKSGSATQSSKLPLVPGEIVYTYFIF
jgi:hypothetical protein